MDCIFALSTPPGRSGIAVLRVSGAGSRNVLQPLCGQLPETGRTVRFLRDKDGELIDQALILVFGERASFTGEEVVELHVHGSVAVIKRVLQWLGTAPGCRPAEAGEFTRRAMENGLLDFAQVEGLADLIDAETEAQRRQAVRLLTGDLGRKAAEWRRSLLEASGLLAAAIDFADEDIPPDHVDRIRVLLQSVAAELRAEARGAAVAERIRDGFEVAIVGRPNVGKSTLLNRLAGRSAALTSEIAGTTRDVIEVRIEVAGLPVTLLDTAGIRESGDPLEAMGIERAKARAELADVRIHLVDNDGSSEIEICPGDIVLLAKGDLKAAMDNSVSGMTGFGVERMLFRLEERLIHLSSGVGTATRQRHLVGLVAAAERLEAALESLTWGSFAEDIVAEELRLSMTAIDSLVARVDVEEVLGWVFSQFCIGK